MVQRVLIYVNISGRAITIEQLKAQEARLR